MNKKKEIADAMNKSKLQLKCPSCGSRDVTLLEAARKLLTGSNTAFPVAGLVVIAMFIFMEKPDDWSPHFYTIVQLVAVFMIITSIWNGAFGLPLLIFRNFWAGPTRNQGQVF